MESILRCPVGAVLYNDQPSHLANFVSGDDRNRNTSIADCQWSVVRIRYSESVLVPYIVHGTRRIRAPELEYKYPHHFRLLERNHPLQSILKNTPASKQQTLHLPTIKMQLSTILTFTVALLAGHALASPELQKRTTCQACSVGGIEGGPACCSAHVRCSLQEYLMDVY